MPSTVGEEAPDGASSSPADSASSPETAAPIDAEQAPAPPPHDLPAAAADMECTTVAEEPAPPESTPVDTPSSPVPNAETSAEPTTATPPNQPGAVAEAEVRPAAACSVSASIAQSELLQFVPLHDIVPCDFNQDGIVDVLALNHRVSTGYGFAGIGNGVFDDGPSFDLPFRPAAAACVGDPLDNSLVLVSTEGSVALLHPLVSSDPLTRLVRTPFQIVALGGDVFSGTIAVASDESPFSEVYRLVGGGLALVGEYAVASALDLAAWYAGVLGWTEGELAIPLPPAEYRRRVRIADLNCDRIPDVVALGRYQIACHLSEAGAPLQRVMRVDLGIDPIAVRLADADGNGLIDILALGSSGNLESVLFEVL